jgi:hypothetical protein
MLYRSDYANDYNEDRDTHVNSGVLTTVYRLRILGRDVQIQPAQRASLRAAIQQYPGNESAQWSALKAQWAQDVNAYADATLDPVPVAERKCVLALLSAAPV